MNEWEIRRANKDDIYDMAYVHYNSWIETYTGLIAKEFLETRTLEKSINSFSRVNLDNSLVLNVDGKIVGFITFGESRDNDLKLAGEVFAIYILNKYQKQGYGTKLMENAILKLNEQKINKVAIWVLEGNNNSINFYQKQGFIKDNEKEVVFHNPVKLLRFIKEI